MENWLRMEDKEIIRVIKSMSHNFNVEKQGL